MNKETSLYYTYYSYEEFGRGYIGYRKCPSGETPESDQYLGSFNDKSFKPTSKIVLTVHNSKEDAILAEIKIQKLFNVVDNPHFANKAFQTSKSFCYSRLGEKHTEESKRKMSERHSGKILSPEHRKKISENNTKEKNPFFGRRHTEETKRMLSERMSGEKAPFYGRKHTNDSKKKIAEGISKPANLFHPDYSNTLSMSITNLKRNFPELNLNLGHLSEVANGKRSQHKGWRLHC